MSILSTWGRTVCKRREIVDNKIYCKPVSSPPNMSVLEKIKHPEFYQTRLVSGETCLACPECEAGFQFQSEATMHGRPREILTGELVYPKRGWEPPPVPEGYRRKSDDLRTTDAWVMVPVLPECTKRSEQVTYSRCGAAVYSYLCTLRGAKVTAKQCLACGGR